MAELLTMIALAANVIAASAFAKFASIIATGAATAHEQSSDVDTFEGRVAARIRIRNRRSEASREVGEFTRAYW